MRLGVGVEGGGVGSGLGSHLVESIDVETETAEACAVTCMLLLQQRHGLSLHPPLRLRRRHHARFFDSGFGHLLQLRRVLVIFESIGLMPCLELREGDTKA